MALTDEQREQVKREHDHLRRRAETEGLQRWPRETFELAVYDHLAEVEAALAAERAKVARLREALTRIEVMTGSYITIEDATLIGDIAEQSLAATADPS